MHLKPNIASGQIVKGLEVDARLGCGYCCRFGCCSASKPMGDMIAAHLGLQLGLPSTLQVLSSTCHIPIFVYYSCCLMPLFHISRVDRDGNTSWHCRLLAISH